MINEPLPGKEQQEIDKLISLYDSDSEYLPDEIDFFDRDTVETFNIYFDLIKELLSDEKSLQYIFFIRQSLDRWTKFYKSIHRNASMPQVLDAYTTEALFLEKCGGTQYKSYLLFVTIANIINQFTVDFYTGEDLAESSLRSNQQLEKLMQVYLNTPSSGYETDVEMLRRNIHDYLKEFIQRRDFTSKEYKIALGQITIQLIADLLHRALQDSVTLEDIQYYISGTIENKRRVMQHFLKYRNTL